MTSEIIFNKLNGEDKDQIITIANWYFDEWETPIESTLNRLENQPSGEVLFQVVAIIGNKLVATAGLSNEVNLIREHKKFNNLKPWINSLYTSKKYRKQGIGEMLLENIEQRAKAVGIQVIYLTTFTAESLYTKCGWKEIDRVIYKGHDTVIMKKEL